MNENMAMLGRRSFLLGMGVMGAGIAGVGMAGCSPKSKESDHASDDAKTAEPDEITADTVNIINTRDLMTLDELNAKRKQLVDSKTDDYVKADGTVIPNVYVKLQALLNTYGNGVGSEIHDNSFNEVMYLFKPEEAQAYLEMPMGVMFTAKQFADASGRAEQDCTALCDELASRGLLFRTVSNGEAQYHQLAEAHGIWEYNLNNYEKNNGEYVQIHWSQWGTDIANQLYNARTSFYTPVPVSREVVGDSSIALEFDDYEAVIKKFDTIAVSPCQCRLSHKALGKEDPGDHPLETCITLGEEAEYYIANGIARQIDQQEALDIVHHSVECGMVIQICNSKNTEVICSCHGDCCDILGSYVTIAQSEDLKPEDFNVFEHLSHYNLRHDKDTCLKCGKCAERCPLFAITMDEETGFPTVNGTCVRCGQCGTVCPVGARTLHLADSILELPDDLLDDYNTKAKYRFANGMVY